MCRVDLAAEQVRVRRARLDEARDEPLPAVVGHPGVLKTYQVLSNPVVVVNEM